MLKELTTVMAKLVILEHGAPKLGLVALVTKIDSIFASQRTRREKSKAIR